MATITIANSELRKAIGYIESLSDILTARHKESHSGTEQLVLMSAIQDVDRVAVSLKEQLEFWEGVERDELF